MPGRFSTCGPKHLARKNELAASQAKFQTLRDVLLIDTGHLDAERLTATLHVILGYKSQIRTAWSLADAVVYLETEPPTVVFVDDVPEPGTDAEQAIPLLRKAGFAGAIIVVGEKVAPARRAKLLQIGASEVIHRDDLDSVSVAEALALTQQLATKSNAPG
jgi:DNA-binding NarL/FixJ family response regulator